MLQDTSPRSVIRWVAVAVGAILIGVPIIFGSWYTVDQRERGVVLRNGAVTGVAAPGLGFKVPIIDSVVFMSMESQLAQYDKMSIYSRDQQPALIRMSVGWRPLESGVDDIYAQYGSIAGIRDRLISPKVFEEAKNVFGRYNAVTAIQERGRLNADIRAALIAAIKGPIQIESVQIENVDFSDAYEKSIEERMLAEVEVQKLKQNAEREKVQAEIVVTKANAAADAVRADAQARADAALLAGKAAADVTRLRGDAEAQAIRARGEALRQNAGLVELQAVEKWDGKLPVTMIPGSVVPFIGVK